MLRNSREESRRNRYEGGGENGEDRLRKLEESNKRLRDIIRGLKSNLSQAENDIEDLRLELDKEKKSREEVSKQLKEVKAGIIRNEKEWKEIRKMIAGMRMKKENEKVKTKSVVVSEKKEDVKERLGVKRKWCDESEEEMEREISMWDVDDDKWSDIESDEQVKEKKEDWVSKEKGLVVFRARNWDDRMCMEEWLEKTLDVEAETEVKVEKCKASGVMMVYFKNVKMKRRLWKLKR